MMRNSEVTMHSQDESISLQQADRKKVVAFEAGLSQAITDGKLYEVKIEPVHYFAGGLYAREITIPKGTCLTGKIHLFEHLNIISKGDISVMTDEGIKRIVAPATIVSKPGIKRVGYAHEDTVWTTILVCTETDPDKAEAMLVVETFEQFELAMSTNTSRLEIAAKGEQ
jgi:hypothetical protein